MFFEQIGMNKVLWFSILSCILAQVIKIFTSGDKRIDFRRAVSSGGMPSSHSSFVTCLATMVGIKNGFDSDIFAATLVFALIIMYDAAGVRLAVGRQAAILNQIVLDLQNKKQIEQKKLKELVGHTPKQVIVGAIMGILIGIFAAR